MDPLAGRFAAAGVTRRFATGERAELTTRSGIIVSRAADGAATPGAWRRFDPANDGMRATAIAQNLLSVLLFFFFGLALRNYFKVK